MVCVAGMIGDPRINITAKAAMTLCLRNGLKPLGFPRALNAKLSPASEAVNAGTSDTRLFMCFLMIRFSENLSVQPFR